VRVVGKGEKKKNRGGGGKLQYTFARYKGEKGKGEFFIFREGEKREGNEKIVLILVRGKKTYCIIYENMLT